MIAFQNRLEGIKLLLFSLLFFLMLLMGAWFSYSLVKKYRKKYGENKLFYRDEDIFSIRKKEMNNILSI